MPDRKKSIYRSEMSVDQSKKSICMVPVLFVGIILTVPMANKQLITFVRLKKKIKIDDKVIA